MASAFRSFNHFTSLKRRAYKTSHSSAQRLVTRSMTCSKFSKRDDIENSQQRETLVSKDDAGSRSSENHKSSTVNEEKSNGKKLTLTQRIEKCFPKSPTVVLDPCVPTKSWQRGTYKKDSCGSGIIPVIHSYAQNRRIWCKTPLSTYQSTIGELGRKILCREPGSIVPRDIRSEPPCNICEHVLPPCRGFYRQYDCIRPCEEEYATVIGNRRIYRDAVSRYWDPCTSVDKPDVNVLAPHNGMLAKKLHRGMEGADCW